MKKYCLSLVIFSLSISSAADVLIDTPLNFGEIAIRNNNAASTVSISRNGVQLSTNQIYVIKPGTPAVISLSNFPTYTLVNLSVDFPAFSAMSYPDTAQFEFSAVDMPTSVNLGPTGSAQFKMGGTIKTSGNPAENYYSGASYTIYLNLNLDY